MMEQETQDPATLQGTQNDSLEVSVPSQSLTPCIKNKDAAIKKMLREDYGLRVDSLELLNGFYDLNYRLTASRVGQSNLDLNSNESKEYFLKISNLDDSKRPEFLDAVTKMMEHLRQKGIPCQETIRGVEGQATSQISSSGLEGNPVTYLASLRTFLPGQVLKAARLTPEMLYHLGQFVAKTTLALQDFQHPFFDTYDHHWNLTNCTKCSEMLFVIKDTRQRNISENILHAFRTQVLASNNQLRAGQIHGDFNENNILISTNSNALPGAPPHICGLLDLQDTCRSYMVFELAICVAHMILVSHGNNNASASTVPMTEIPGHVLAGYESVLELRPGERLALRVCVAARMVTCLVGGAHAYHHDPGNDYLVSYGEAGWEALVTFWSCDPHVLENKWDQILHAYRIHRGYGAAAHSAKLN